ncbi:MAG: RagB/SusD family nutrient uptake outer membrane protein [Bacteroidales bacterium]|nr:RagB/SusD family nutrient uptake outer membrane protein [Bacteroidales bacterium]
MNINKLYIIMAIVALMGTFACSDLEETPLDEQLGHDLINDPTNINGLINPPYATLRRIIEWFDYWALQQISTDETAFPTRGSDWYDNGAWQQLHLHTWTPDHIRLTNVWTVLSQGISRSNTAIYYIGQFPQNDTTVQYINEARFLRAYYVYLMVDLFGQVPFREADDLNFTTTPDVMDRKTATDFVISEVNEVYPNLKTRAENGSERVTKGAADALLAKVYLNYNVYTGEEKWTEAITHCNNVINSGEYTVTDDYWSMFQWDVTGVHPEFILTVPMTDAVDMGSGSVWINFTLHYNQIFGTYTSFWNGGVTTEDFVSTFDSANDVRFNDTRIMNETGFNQGFLIGQQRGPDGTALTTRDGSPLVFTPDFNLTNSDETKGIRVIKYAPNPNTERQFSSSNDVPLFRISDVYLIRAEASLRNGDAASALSDVNFIRGMRSAPGKTLPLLTSVTLNDILNERGFELYWEGHRRQDLVRFDMFTEAYQEKPVTEEYRELYAIPTSALDVNDKLTQNPGYQ